jgi:CheY-like chemotaxis protein
MTDRLSILLVEDDVDFAESFGELLQEFGHDVAVAQTSGTGLTLARGRPFDVGFFDINLPDSDGFQLTETLTNENLMSHCFLVTASGIARYEERARQAGAEGILHKPLNFDAVQEILASIGR